MTSIIIAIILGLVIGGLLVELTPGRKLKDAQKEIMDYHKEVRKAQQEHKLNK